MREPPTHRAAGAGRGRPIFHKNTKLATGRNVTRRYVNGLLTSINLPAVGQNTLKAREREVGAAIETVARNSCLEGLQLEKDCRRTVDTEQVVKIGVLYDMITQKRGKGHNSLTG
ncbi:unnamed protein product [Porites lobata]|uniref:Mutator-like transposase domain-containing protein n=1 Tax=Porites lobata TaxID=104759 RepID=A0ABN8PUA4_9CNID|nr:unnamed protein product [Porites lobata]